MANGLLSAELAATCNALGYYDGQKYHLEPHSKETIKDVIRYLRRDEDSHDIRRFLGNTKLLETDLVPILVCHAKDNDLFDVVLRLVVNLTTPALIIYNEVVPADKNDLNQYLQLISHLQAYKEAFSDQKIWAVLTERLSALLGKELESRDDDDQRNIERILILVRNVLHVPANASSDWRPDNDASLHDQVIWALHQSGLLDLLLYMASSSQESAFFMHLLEIICLIVREQPASLLAETASQRSIDEKHRDEQELLNIRLKEQKMRQYKAKKHFGTRHSNFGGTFVIKNMKSTSDKDVIYHKPLSKVDSFTLDAGKKPKKIPKNRLPLKCETSERRSALSVRLILKQFCVEILNAAYNPLMRHVKDCLVRGKSQNNDESYYFTALKFFMEFNRKYKFQVKLVSETMSVETFYFVQKYLETWHEMMVTDKKKLPLWSTRMHIALKAYKELLQNLIAMDGSSEEAVRESSKVIKSNVFYVVEYREMLLTLINTYKKTKYSHQYLIDLLETIHIFLKLLSNFCQNKKIIVQKHLTSRKKKSKKNKKQKKPVPENDALWPLMESKLEKVFTSPITKEVIPFDATSDKDIEEQKVDAMKRIQILLKSGDCEEAVALMKASREVWPENDCFGRNDMSQEEEINCFKEVFLADLDVTGLNVAEVEESEEEEGTDEEAEDAYQSIAEQSFDVHDLVKRFASPKVMSVCITLLSTFEKNSAFTNHCVTKMLHRIAWDCKLPSMLFQASLFRKFQQIMESMDPSHKELARLAKYIIQKFTEVASTNKKLLLELLFFKNAKDAYEIECGYGSFQEKSKSAAMAWEEHEEDELRRLHDEYKRTKPSEGFVDWIMDNIINKNRSKRSIKKKLKELDLLIEEKSKDWTEEQKEELKQLYEEFKDSEDPLSNIGEKLSLPRSRRNIANTLVKIGCVDSTKALRKKRKKQGSGGISRKEEESDSDISSSEDEDERNPETREEIRARESVPDLIDTFSLLFEQKEVDIYLQEGLQWLKECMEECVEDMDDDPTEVPLLPLSNEAILSIENKEFQNFLLSLGIFRPLEQEMYWRFSSTWRDTDFRNRQNLINLLIENKTVEECFEEARKIIREITGKDCEDENLSDNNDEESPLKDFPDVEPDNSKNLSKNKKNKKNDEALNGKKSSKNKRSKNKKDWINSRMFKDTDSENESESEAAKSTFNDAKEENEIKKVSNTSDEELQEPEILKGKKSPKNKGTKNKSHSIGRNRSRVLKDTDSENELESEASRREDETKIASDTSDEEKENRETSKGKGTKNKSQSTIRKKSRILKDTDSENELETETIIESTSSAREVEEIKNVSYMSDEDTQSNTKEVISLDEADSPNLESGAHQNKRSRMLDSDSEDESVHLGKKRKHIILSDDED
ncbi:protein timeless homolog [Halyomorpha halys]|uniref:protein timeless homolog n=1 Tax=Halyomorpha halys TaxID=286706 RepID=UPI0006D4F281|nr:protein timeless homolog [Halyomorpha halys]